MSAQQGSFGGNGGKKAVHVKWAGKTIALGTFPSAEADEKCARAKALTRAWRSTMRPKPSRDWVMLELERLGVRVVSGRLGRKAGEEDDSDKKGEDMVGSGGVPRASSMGWASPDADLNSLMQRRSSSLGLALMSDNDLNRRSSIGSLGQVVGLEGEMPPHRPFVGGGSAAAYEAARADHYAQKREEQQRRASSLGLGLGGVNLGGGAGLSQMGMSVNPNQHYEMLKLHHMNLLNEIQETTLMMNLYQQQQLQQQQQQLQQQQQAAASEVGGLGGADPQMALLLQQQHHQQANPPSIESLYGGGLANQRASLGLGSPNANQMQLLRQQQMLQNASGVQQELLKGQVEQAALEDRLLKLKEDIARRQKEAEELEATAGKGGDGGLSGDKRKVDDGGDNDPKRVKLEDDGDDDDDDDDDDEDD